MVQVIGSFPLPTSAFPRTAAKNLGVKARVALSLAMLAGDEPVTHLAQRLGVSRKFCYQQAYTAADSLAEAFAARPEDEQTLFELPVTRQWVEQLATIRMVDVCLPTTDGRIFIQPCFSFGDDPGQPDDDLVLADLFDGYGSVGEAAAEGDAAFGVRVLHCERGQYLCLQ